MGYNTKPGSTEDGEGGSSADIKSASYNTNPGVTIDNPDGGSYDNQSSPVADSVFSKVISKSLQHARESEASAAESLASQQAAAQSEANAATSAGLAEGSKDLAQIYSQNSFDFALNAHNDAAAALASQQAAAQSEENAAISETNAANSATDSSNFADNSETYSINAANSASAASLSASAANTSKLDAANSANNAATSEENAATSETNAELSATASANSAAAASISASNAAQSESNASNSESNASTSETNAANSAASALSYSDAANLSKLSASASATNAANSATDAANSATNALASETNAATSETNADTSATAAATSEANALTSADNAAISESNAAESESAASTSATNAATSEANAATSATNAATSATASANFATASANYAGNSANSASAAATSASGAATSEANTAALLDAFDDRYLGSKASEPTLDNDGNALLEGAIYWNSSTKNMYVYNGTSWQLTAYSLATASTDELAEGSNNLYYKDERALSALSSSLTTLQDNIDNEASARASGDSSTLTSAQSYTDTAIANLVDTAPSTLDTLNELAAALGDDPNFATTVTNNLATKANNSVTVTGTGVLGGGGDLTANRTITHNTSGVTAGTYGSSTQIPSITVNDTGHVTGVSNNSINVGDGTLTVSAGSGLTGSGSFTANQSTNATITISHADTSTQGSVNNTGRTYIQDITLDTYGHITGIVSATETVIDTNTTYTLDGSSSVANDVNLELKGSDNSTDFIKVVGSGATTVAWDEANQKLTVSSTDTNTDTNTTYSLDGSSPASNSVNLELIAGGSGSGTDTINIVGSGATTVAWDEANQKITISSTDTDTNTWRPIHDSPVDGATTTSISSNWAFDNVKTSVPVGAVFTDTTYTAGSGIDLNGTTFSHTDTSTQGSVNNSSGTVIQDITLDTYGHITSIGSTNLDGRYALLSHTHNYLVNTSDSEQTGDFGVINWNQGSARVNSDPRTNEFGYDPDLTAIHWWSTTAAGANYGRVGHALYNGSAYQYFHTKASQNNLYINNQAIFHDGYHPNADKWTTARTLSLTGDASGSTSWDGSGNASISVTVNNDSHTHSIDTITDEHRIFNNMGNNHSTYTDFNSIDQFGFRYVQGSTNGPGTGSSQFYGMTLGLGNEYALSSYGMQLAIPRYEENDKYISFRTRENGTWSSWVKISAGYADSAGSASTATTATNVDGGYARISSIRGTDQTIENTYGAYQHIGGWGVGRTASTAVLVNTAYMADIWSSTRTNTVTLTGDVTGSGSASVNGSGNWTVSIAATVGDNSHSHDSISWLGRISAETGRNTYRSGVYNYSTFTSTDNGGNPPLSYPEVITWGGGASGSIQIAGDWISTTSTPLRVRSLRDCCQDWSSWSQIATSNEYFANNVNIQSPIYYLSDTGYRWQYGSNSNRFYTPSGYIEFGPMNTTWAHIYTDRPNFYFNKDLYVLGQRVFHDTYHPNADKWTTARTNTVTLTGDVTGSGNASVDGSGNWTVSIASTVADDSHSHSNYAQSWRALDNTGNTSGYVKIASLTGLSHSSRFVIQLAGTNSSYSDGTKPSYGVIVGQLNNDSNADLTYYNHSHSTEVVSAVYHVDVSSTAVDVYAQVGAYAELTAIGSISDGTLTPASTYTTSTPSGLVAATELKVFNSGNDGSGSGLDADLLDGQHGSYYATANHNHDGDYGATLALYGTTAGTSGRIRCTAPFATNSAHMFQITISVYSSYTVHTYVVGGYMYPSTNQWYNPTCVYSGTGTPDIIVGRDTNGKAYISIANGNYTGVRVHNMTLGYQTSITDIYDPWTITIDGGTENSVTPPIYKTWNSGNDGSGSGLDADLLDGQHGSYYAHVPSGTAMLFVQTSAPTGWTKSTTHNNKALRVVSGTAGSGGSQAFTTAFASKAVSGTISSTTAGGTVGSTTITTTTMPSHYHYTVWAGGSFDGVGPLPTSTNYVRAIGGSGWEATYLEGSSNYANAGRTSSSGSSFSHNHSFSGSSHNHTFTGTAIDMSVQYVDVIIATKD